MNKTNVEEWEEGVRDELYKLFGMDGKDGTYWHILTRVKEARQVGTLTIDDYKEVEMDDLEDIVWLIRKEVRLAEKRGREEARMLVETIHLYNTDGIAALEQAEKRGAEKVIDAIPERNEFGQPTFIDYIDPTDGRRIVKSMFDIKQRLKSKFLTNTNT